MIPLFSISLLACVNNSSNNKSSEVTDANHSQPSSLNNKISLIPIDTANMMILSYLNSINYTNNDSDLHSLIVDAEALRAYLTEDSSGRSIQKIKIMFAHTMDYINSGGANQNAGYQSRKLTIVLAGYDYKGDYIYFGDNQVMNRFAPCPHLCPELGTAALDTFVLQ